MICRGTHYVLQRPAEARPQRYRLSRRADHGVLSLSDQEDRKTQHQPSGLARRLLKLLVEIDSSRFLSRRLAAALGLVCMLGSFAAAGYWLPALVQHYLPR